MAAPIDFYFDFSSPYGYLAAMRIDALAAPHQREVNWRPILLGPAFKVSGNAPLTLQPLKGDYARRDFSRTARFLGIPFNMPAQFPISTHNAARAFYWLRDRDPAKAKQMALAVYRTYFVEARDITAAEVVVDIAAQQGVNREELGAALAGPAVKERLKNEVESSLAKGVFGSPYIVVDGEAFWGSDRFEQIDAWLKTGGW
ncbi:MAG TPA: 2-hydroxychromene-2-carboxylate isomerase [Usitatibacteraceae bacterium]